MPTQLWKIIERPEFEIEFTGKDWIIWGPCINNNCYNDQEDCRNCRGTKQSIIDSCPDIDGTPEDYFLLRKVTHKTDLTIVRVQ